MSLIRFVYRNMNEELFIGIWAPYFGYTIEKKVSSYRPSGNIWPQKPCSIVTSISHPEMLIHLTTVAV